MKNLIKTSTILAFFYCIGVATSINKNLYFPCEFQINSLLSKDSFVQSYYRAAYNDTILIGTQKDTLWDIKTAAICQVLKDSCKVSGYKILVLLDTVYNQANWNSPYGKQIYFRQCP